MPNFLSRTLIACAAWSCMALAGAAVEANKATEAELDGVRGVGPALSARIIEARSKKPFADWEDFIARIPGIGHVRAAHLSAEGLKVEGKRYQLPGVPALPTAPAAPAAPKIPPAPPKPPMPAAPKGP